MKPLVWNAPLTGAAKMLTDLPVIGKRPVRLYAYGIAVGWLFLGVVIGRRDALAAAQDEESAA